MTILNYQHYTNDELLQIISEATSMLKGRLNEKMPFKAVEPATPALKERNARQVVIAQAKRCIEGLQDKDYYKIGWLSCNAEFIVNEEKRVVVVLLKGFKSGKVHTKGVAKCDPQDVFNIHIGKAIALYRALGQDVPEIFTNPPQPENTEVGDIVNYNGTIYKVVEENEWKASSGVATVGSIAAKRGTIINDSKE